MTTTKKQLNELRKTLLKEISDYTKAVNSESRKRPVYLEKDSDVAIDSLRNAFEEFISANRS